MKRRPLEIYDDARIVAERHREKGYEKGAVEERAKIVAWLLADGWSARLDYVANAIEAGEHLK